MMMKLPKLVLTLALLFKLALIHEARSDKKNYIIYMGDLPELNTESVIVTNHDILSSLTGSPIEAQKAIIHNYHKSFRGFSAKLTPDQAQKLTENEQVISVFESKMARISTTRSWDFLHIDSIHQLHNSSLSLQSQSDVIVGILDSGIWPESPSFRDEGLPPVPERFRGKCTPGENFTTANCNRKIIGAKYYYKGFEATNGPLGSSYFLSARDSGGHGSHTASTVAGAAVHNVSLFGAAGGTARGGAPGARLAIYKVCWGGMCDDADILAAIDDAIHDDVDILSMSLGASSSPRYYFENSISIGSFHAFRKGIFVSAAAGNSFSSGTVDNVAPWILTVAASSIDRRFQTNVILGNSTILKGISLNGLETEGVLIAGSDARAPGVEPQNASYCKRGTLDPAKVKGKIVVCHSSLPDDDGEGAAKQKAMKQDGRNGIILINPIDEGIAPSIDNEYPFVQIGQQESQKLRNYMAKREGWAVAKISKTRTLLNTKPAPQVAVFSSRGPSTPSPQIIKPDITGPGVDILAAWSPTQRGLNYNIVSGTSMACPHLTAIVAILKSFHPNWSPSTLKSAIMTTATTLDNTRNLISNAPNHKRATPFDLGSGHVNPSVVVDPGLVYEFDTQDVLQFLCSIGINSTQIRSLTGGKPPVQCTNPRPSYDFNYPSIGVHSMNGSLTVTRTVTYYGRNRSVYVAHVVPPTGVRVMVTPNRLEFGNYGERKSFSMHFRAAKGKARGYVFGALKWSDGFHTVRSPIAVSIHSKG